MSKFVQLMCIIFCIALTVSLTGIAGNTALGTGPLTSTVRAAAAEDELYFTILHTNDEHSSLIPHSPAVDYHRETENTAVGGFARLAAAIRAIRAEKSAAGEPVLLLSGGDFLGGPAYGWLTPAGYAPELLLMQAMGYDAVVIGNHEYDYGPDILASYLRAAGYPDARDKTILLATNSEIPGDHPLSTPGMLEDTHLFTLENGLRVGIFGIMGRTAGSYAELTAEPVAFTDFIEASRQAVDQLRSRGADIIVALTHSGIDEDRELARAVAGIDIIVGGHCHTALYEPVMEGDTPIVQADSNGKYLGMAELAFNRHTGAVRLRNEAAGKPFLLPIDHRYRPDQEIEDVIAGYTNKLNELIAVMSGGMFTDIREVIVSTNFVLPKGPPLQETPLGNFITDGIRLVVGEYTGERVDVSAYSNGIIRGDIAPGSMDYARGQVSFYDLTALVGLGIGPDGHAGYPVVSFYLTGDEVRRVLEVASIMAEMYGDGFYLQFSGLRYEYNPANTFLFTVPFINQQIPSTRTVKKAELYIGDGIQSRNDQDYIPLRRGDQTLYHVAADSLIYSFLPLVGELLPMLEIIPKNAAGQPLSGEEEAIVYNAAGRELKTWQAVAGYAASLAPGPAGYPEIPDYYRETTGRRNQVKTFPLSVIPPLILLLPPAAVVLLLIRRKRKRQGTVSVL